MKTKHICWIRIGQSSHQVATSLREAAFMAESQNEKEMKTPFRYCEIPSRFGLDAPTMCGVVAVVQECRLSPLFRQSKAPSKYQHLHHLLAQSIIPYMGDEGSHFLKSYPR